MTDHIAADQSGVDERIGYLIRYKSTNPNRTFPWCYSKEFVDVEGVECKEIYTHPSPAPAVAGQSIRNQALEEAAALCERIGEEYDEREGRKYAELRTDAVGGCRDCESAIRALKTAAPSEGEES